jgi:RNA polymerase sigma-70 factor (ECF subfamily)
MYWEGVRVEEKQFDACMKRMKSGDKGALHEIYEAYLGYIYAIVRQTVSNREDAEDVTSEFFMKLWRLADTYRGGNGHRAWMAAIARNMAVDLMRKTKREILTEQFADNMTETASEACVEQEVLSDLSLRQALDALKPSEQQVVHLKIMGELTFQEIADILKIPLGTVTWRYQNAIKKLRRYGYE